MLHKAKVQQIEQTFWKSKLKVGNGNRKSQG